jgi:hypothetical protein
LLPRQRGGLPKAPDLSTSARAGVASSRLRDDFNADQKSGRTDVPGSWITWSASEARALGVNQIKALIHAGKQCIEPIQALIDAYQILTQVGEVDVQPCDLRLKRSEAIDDAKEEFHHASNF